MRSATVSLVAAIAAPIVAVLALVPFREEANSANLALVLVIVVVTVAATGTRAAAPASAIVTVLAYDVVLVRPYGSFTIARPDEVTTAVLLFIVGVTVGEVAHRARRQRRFAREREDDLGLLYHLIELVSAGASDRELIAIAEREISELLRSESCRYVPEDERNKGIDEGADRDEPDHRPEIDRTGRVLMGELLWPAEELGLPSGHVDVPLMSGGLRLGAFVVATRPTERVERWRLVVVVMVADLVASALARWPVPQGDA